MEKDIINNRRKQPEEKIIYAPLEEIINIERVIDNLEIIRRELQKVVKGMRVC
jgi:hypothetical protein